MSDAEKSGEYLVVETNAPEFEVEFSRLQTFKDELPRGDLAFIHKSKFALYEASLTKAIAYSLTRGVYVISDSSSNTRVVLKHLPLNTNDVFQKPFDGSSE